MITTKGIYNLSKTSIFIKSKKKKIFFVHKKKALKRKIPANKVQGITISKTSP